MKRFLLSTTILLFALPVWAQESSQTQIGGTIGGGTYELPGERFFFGAEACLICDERYAIFAGYQRWKAEAQSVKFGGADSAFGGLRIQGTSIIRPFLDVGVVAGNGNFRSGSPPALHSTTTVGGIVGAGITLLIEGKMYMRPQFHVAAMSKGYLSTSVGLGIGARF